MPTLRGSENIFVKVYQEPLASILEHDLTKRQLEIFIYFISMQDYKGKNGVKVQDICDKLGMEKAGVSRAIKKLVEIDVIVPAATSGRYQTYRLNPRIVYKGGQKHNEERQAAAAYDRYKERGQADG